MSDLDRFLEWRAKISEDLNIPMPMLIDAEAGTFAEVCKCGDVVAVIKVVDHGMAVEVLETLHGARHRQPNPLLNWGVIMTWIQRLREFTSGTQMSDRCQWCGRRFAVPPGHNRGSWRHKHEGWCDRSVACPRCLANAGERCHTASGSNSPSHISRVLLAYNQSKGRGTS